MHVIDLHLYVKFRSSAGIFHTFASANQLPGLSISGKLAACAYILFCVGFFDKLPVVKFNL